MLRHGRLPPDFGGGPARRPEDLEGAAALLRSGPPNAGRA
jgi:hypothetical protein